MDLIPKIEYAVCGMDVESFSAVNSGHQRLGMKVPGIRM